MTSSSDRAAPARACPPERRPAPWVVLDRAAVFSSSLELGAFCGTVRFMRQRARELLGEWGLGELADDAESVVDELVLNAVEATVRAGLDTPVRLTLLAGLRTVLIAVWDATDGGPVSAGSAVLDLDNFIEDYSADPDQHGRGLVMVEALSLRWGCRPMCGDRPGKVVWSLIAGKRAGA
jgi:anti-sigma regulatory factor (Ser/Thr protein kinase)